MRGEEEEKKKEQGEEEDEKEEQGEEDGRRGRGMGGVSKVICWKVNLNQSKFGPMS